MREKQDKRQVGENEKDGHPVDARRMPFIVKMQGGAQLLSRPR